MEFLDYFLDTKTLPIITAFILGVITALHPCPLTLNITAIGYISNDLDKKQDVLKKGIIYTLGRMATYMTLSLIIYAGFDSVKISHLLHGYGEKIIGPFLFISGIVMLDLFAFQLPFVEKISSFLIGKNKKNKDYNSFALGAIFALAFCPHTVILYFGMLIPLTLASSEGIILPAIYAIGTGLPVILVAWLLTYSISKIGSFYSKVKTIETWMRKITAIIFIFAGIYFIIENFLTKAHCC